MNTAEAKAIAREATTDVIAQYGHLDQAATVEAFAKRIREAFRDGYNARKYELDAKVQESTGMPFTTNELIWIQNGLVSEEDDYGVKECVPLRERIDAEIERRKAEEGA